MLLLFSLLNYSCCSVIVSNSLQPHGLAARQASLPLTIESVMPSNHPILCLPLLLLPSILPSIRVFSNESAVRIRWPKDWRFRYSVLTSYSGR